MPHLGGEFREIWATDTEFKPEGRIDGGKTYPLCLVGRELRSGRIVRVWRDELLRMTRAPFDTGPDSAMVAYFASAEIGCFISLGWPMPRNVVDLYVEHRWRNNGGKRDKVRKLVDIMRDHGLPFMSELHKEEMRNKILGQDDYSTDDRLAITNYCSEDTEALDPLYRRSERWIDFPRALLRGRYMIAASRVEQNGIPTDTAWWNRLVEHREAILKRYVAEADKPYGVYGDGLSWSDKRFKAYLNRRGIPWRFTEIAGRPVLDDDFLTTMARAHPELDGLRQIRNTIKALQKPELAIGIDGRNRTPVAPVGAVTGRNTPKAGRHLFGPTRWLRCMIKPPIGSALAYVDWVAQEIAIAAALSQDAAMLADYASADPYIAFAKATGLAPPGANKTTHKALRDKIKVLFLASNYGMGAESFATQAGISVAEARELLELHKSRYRVYWRWLQRVVERADLTSHIHTPLGWRMNVLDETRETTLRNWMMQAVGAELMRLAAIELTETGVRVCAIVHDAFLIEAPLTEIEEVSAYAERVMRRASEELLGITIRTESALTRYPGRFIDPKGGHDMWVKVDGWLREIEGR